MILKIEKSTERGYGFNYYDHGVSVRKLTWVEDANAINIPHPVRMNPQRAKMVACRIKAMVETEQDYFNDEYAQTPGEPAYVIERRAKKIYQEWKEEKKNAAAEE